MIGIAAAIVTSLMLRAAFGPHRGALLDQFSGQLVYWWGGALVMLVCAVTTALLDAPGLAIVTAVLAVIMTLQGQRELRKYRQRQVSDGRGGP